MLRQRVEEQEDRLASLSRQGPALLDVQALLVALEDREVQKRLKRLTTAVHMDSASTLMSSKDPSAGFLEGMGLAEAQREPVLKSLDDMRDVVKDLFAQVADSRLSREAALAELERRRGVLDAQLMGFLDPVQLKALQEKLKRIRDLTTRTLSQENPNKGPYVMMGGSGMRIGPGGGGQ